MPLSSTGEGYARTLPVALVYKATIEGHGWYIGQICRHARSSNDALKQVIRKHYGDATRGKNRRFHHALRCCPAEHVVWEVIRRPDAVEGHATPTVLQRWCDEAQMEEISKSGGHYPTNPESLNKEVRPQIENRELAEDMQEVAWDCFLGYLREYAAREGNADVPSTYQSEDGYPLGRKVMLVRNEGMFVKGQRQRCELMEQELDFKWMPAPAVRGGSSREPMEERRRRGEG